MKSGYLHRKDIHLSQKRTCGRIDTGASVYNGCYAYEDTTYHFGGDYCHLRFLCKNGVPLEPCYKPKTTKQYLYALKLRGL